MNENKYILDLLEKAQESLKASEILFKEKLFDSSASRVYYAIFYAVEAVLLTKELSFSKHSGVISSFNKEFIKTKIFPEKLKYYLNEAFNMRQKSDYGPSRSISSDKAQALIEQAKEFISITEEYLKKEGF